MSLIWQAKDSTKTPVCVWMFETHFGHALKDDPDTFDRAKWVFRAVGRLNPRSISIQMHTAMAFGKLTGVLDAYEAMIADERFRRLDGVSMVTTVRAFADVIYRAEIFRDVEMADALKMRQEIGIPDMFNRMEPQVRRDSQN